MAGRGLGGLIQEKGSAYFEQTHGYINKFTSDRPHRLYPTLLHCH